MPTTTLGLATSRSAADKATNLTRPTVEAREAIISSSAVPLVLGEVYSFLLASTLSFTAY